MKCPKCEYLGFETTDRCKNCGYDFSLMTSPGEGVDFDLPLRDAQPLQAAPFTSDAWLSDLDRKLALSTPERPMPEFDIELGAALLPGSIETVAHAPAALDLSQFDVSPVEVAEPFAPATEIVAVGSAATSHADPVVSDVVADHAPTVAVGADSTFATDVASVDRSGDTSAEDWVDSIGEQAESLDSRAAALVDEAMAESAPTAVTSGPTPPTLFTPSSLPLFTPNPDDDTPLVRLPAAPRAPLAVRKTPENPRLRNASRPARKEPEPTPALQFDDAASVDVDSSPVVMRPRQSDVGGGGARLVAAVIDNAILGVIDLVVLYFTLKLAALSLGDWQQIPLAPMLTFLLVMKLFYFAGFTAVGGQTIGKMGSGIRVIAADGSPLDVAQSCRRSLASLLSLVTLGAGFLPALFGHDHRAIHDRVAGTRVVTV